MAAEHPDSGGWQAPVDISVPAPGGGVPQVAVDALGDATVVWAQPDDLGYTVKAAVRLAGGTWGTPVDSLREQPQLQPARSRTSGGGKRAG